MKQIYSHLFHFPSALPVQSIMNELEVEQARVNRFFCIYLYGSSLKRVQFDARYCESFYFAVMNRCDESGKNL